MDVEVLPVPQQDDQGIQDYGAEGSLCFSGRRAPRVSVKVGGFGLAEGVVE